MKRKGFLGIDTSNYTTSGAVCDEEGKILANVRILLPVGEGERGLRQSDAVFAHVKNIPAVFSELSPVLQDTELLAVGCSSQPRREEGSYMPCFLSGIAVAESVSSTLGIPLYRFSHQEGHIMAALYSAGALSLLSEKRFLAFHVSGGTTDLLSVIPDEAGRMAVTRIGTSLDLHAGQAIDRVGVKLGLHFPCGKELEKLARENLKKVPKPKISVCGGDCHFSGLENLAEKLLAETNDPQLVSAFVLEYCAETLEAMTAFADSEFPGLPILYAGGVMSNQFLQERLGRRKNTYFARPEFSSDNASGIALLCRSEEERKLS